MKYIFLLFSFILSFFHYIHGEDQILSYRIPLHHNVSIPRLGLGTAGLQQNGRNSVYKALIKGIALIDTAQANEWYDERYTGLGIKDYYSLYNGSKLNSDEIVIVTKVHPRSFDYEKMYKRMLQSIDSLHKITDNNDPLDVVLIHSPVCWENHCTPEEEAISWKTGWENLEKMTTSSKRQSLVLNIGVSNFDIGLLRELLDHAKVPVSVIQNWMDPFRQDIEVREFCREKGIVYMAYSSFGTQWEWKLQHNPVFTNPLLENIANKHNTSIAKVVISWLLQEDVIAIPRSNSEEHIQDNASLLAFDDTTGEVIGVRVFLDDEDISNIRSLDGILDNLWNKHSDL